MSELAEIEKLAGDLLRRVSGGDRRRLLRVVARDLQKSQSTRIGRQQAADGSPFPKRREKRAETPGGHTVHFLYPKGATAPRAVLMKSWVKQGPLLTGYDIEAGGIRSFFWDEIAKWLPVEPKDEKSGGKLRRRGGIKRAAMFRKMRLGRHLKAGASDVEAWVGFSGRAAEIARVHQEGLRDKPALKAKPVRYERRKLLGVTEADRRRIVDALLAHLAR